MASSCLVAPVDPAGSPFFAQPIQPTYCEYARYQISYDFARSPVSIKRIASTDLNWPVVPDISFAFFQSCQPTHDTWDE